MISLLWVSWRAADLTVLLADERRRRYRVTFRAAGCPQVHRIVVDAGAGDTVLVPVEAWDAARVALVAAARAAVESRSIAA